MKKPTISQSLQLLLLGMLLNKKQELRRVAIDDLYVDPTYQRGLIASTIDRLRGDEFKESALGIFHAGERTKTKRLNLTDGQNRLAAIKLRRDAGLKYPTHVVVIITRNTTQKEEAAEFVKLNTNKPVTGNAKFRARIVEEAEPETLIQKWVVAEGFVLDFLPPGRPTIENTSVNGLYSVTKLLDAYNQCQNHLRPALRLLKAACSGVKKGTKRQVAISVPLNLRSGQVVFGLALFLKKSGLTDVEALAKAIRRRHIDVSALWDSVKKNEGYGYDRPKTFGLELAERMGYGSKVIKKAA